MSRCALCMDVCQRCALMYKCMDVWRTACDVWMYKCIENCVRCKGHDDFICVSAGKVVTLWRELLLGYVV